MKNGEMCHGAKMKNGDMCPWCLDIMMPRGEPAPWEDGYMNTCKVYEARKYCTKDGKAGPGWNPAWPSFQTYGAHEACCACGRGNLGGSGSGSGSTSGSEKASKAKVRSSGSGVGTGSGSSCADAPGWSAPAKFCTDTRSVISVKSSIHDFNITCKQFASRKLCTSDGKRGTGWGLGTYTDEIQEEMTLARKHCCGCGGGRTISYPSKCKLYIETCNTKPSAMCTDSTMAVKTAWGSKQVPWKDTWGSDCAKYESGGLCVNNQSNPIGPNWHHYKRKLDSKPWPKWNAFFADNSGLVNGAAKACCACGGGANPCRITDKDLLVNGSATLIALGIEGSRICDRNGKFLEMLCPNSCPGMHSADGSFRSKGGGCAKQEKSQKIMAERTSKAELRQKEEAVKDEKKVKIAEEKRDKAAEAATKAEEALDKKRKRAEIQNKAAMKKIADAKAEVKAKEAKEKELKAEAKVKKDKKIAKEEELKVQARKETIQKTAEKMAHIAKAKASQGSLVVSPIPFVLLSILCPFLSTCCVFDCRSFLTGRRGRTALQTCQRVIKRRRQKSRRKGSSWS